MNNDTDIATTIAAHFEGGDRSSQSKADSLRIADIHQAANSFPVLAGLVPTERLKLRAFMNLMEQSKNRFASEVCDWSDLERSLCADVGPYVMQAIFKHRYAPDTLLASIDALLASELACAVADEINNTF